MVTRLYTTAVQPVCDSYEDFYASENEDNAVVTISTISFHLGNKFQLAYDRNEQELDEEEFMDARMPGIYDDHPDEEDSRCYTIILPDAHMLHVELDKWIERLNDKFDEDFELWTKCLVCKKDLKLTDRWKPDFPMADHETWKKGRPFCSEQCFRHYRGTDRANLEDSQTEEAKEKRRELEENSISLEELKEDIREGREKGTQD